MSWKPLDVDVYTPPQKQVDIGAESNPQPVPVAELQRIIAATAADEAEQQLQQAVVQAKEECIRRFGSANLWCVASELRSRHGYLVKYRAAMGAKTPKAYLRALRHTFLVVKGVPGMEGTDYVVDINFKDHFTLSHPQPWYEQLLDAVPQDWVGSMDALTVVVGILASAMRWVFRQQRIPLPPWREPSSILSQWLPEWYHDEPVPLVPVPVQTAGIARMLAPYQRPIRAAIPMNKKAWEDACAAWTVRLPPSLPAGWDSKAWREEKSGHQGSPEEPKKIILGFREQSQLNPSEQQARKGLASVVPVLDGKAAGDQTMHGAAVAAVPAAQAPGIWQQRSPAVTHKLLLPSAYKSNNNYKTLDQLLPKFRTVKLGA
eukprot:jgi/Chrzof1/7786/Cz02g36200.t1